MRTQAGRMAELVEELQESLLGQWIEEGYQGRGVSSAARNDGARSLLTAIRQGLTAEGDPLAFDAPAWDSLRDALAAFSSSDAAQGRLAGDTSRFILAMKRPVFVALQQRLAADTGKLMESVLWISSLVDAMAQFTAEAYQRTREDMILRQQRE